MVNTVSSQQEGPFGPFCVKFVCDGSPAPSHKHFRLSGGFKLPIGVNVDMCDHLS